MRDLTRNLVTVIFLAGMLSQVHAQLEEQRYSNASADLPTWVQLMYAADPDPGLVEVAFNAYYATHAFVKDSHTQYYKRWIRELGHDVVPKDVDQRADFESEKRDLIGANDGFERQASNWTCIGPFDWDHGAVNKSYACGAAHVYTVEQAVSNTDLLVAGTANAGLWKSTDKGLSWVNMTKGMLVGEILSVEIDHSTTNTIYFGAAGDLYKSIDAGVSWSMVGDAAFNAVDHKIRDLVLHPTIASILFVCSDQGLYRSTDGGANFTQVQSGTWQELEFKPNDVNTVYAVKQIANRTEFWRSTDAGVTFTQVGTGWPNPVNPDEQKRTEIAVSAAAPNSVFALCTGETNGGSGLYGIYVSADQGSTWSFQCCGASPGGVPSPTNFNLMGWDDGGQDDGGQYYYDLALAVDPANASNVTACGVNRWVSTDGGASFTCPAKWSHSNKPDYVHADIHDLRYYGSDIWMACDGGIFYSNDGGANFTRRMFGIAGTDFWGFGAGGWTGSQVMLGGTYHNGTLLKDNNVYDNGWISTDGGDNYRGFVHPQYDRRALSDYGYKSLSGDRLVSNGNTSWSKLPNATYTIGASSEVVWHPNLVDAAYLGNGTSLWYTTDNGASFQEVHDFGETVTSIEVAFNDPNTIYTCTYPGWWDTKHVWRSTDAGASWTDITPSSATLNGDIWVPFDIATSATDPQALWLVRTSQYGNSPNMNGHLVYKSINGGTTWTNITDAGLDGQWPTNIAHHLGSAGELYIGTRRGVFHRNDAAPAWASWSSGLPAQIASTRLLINYRDALIRNGTDRSVWESGLESAAAPVANFAADRRNVDCLSPQVQFWDNSALNGTNATWSWTFPGGVPSSSSDRAPLVSYSVPGTYDVTLSVTDVNGTHARTITAFITVTDDGRAVPFVEDAENAVVTPPGWTLENPDEGITWTTTSLTMGSDCDPTQAWRVDNYSYNASGEVDRLRTSLIDLSGLTNASLHFDHAYAQFASGYDDELLVEISTDCGANWLPVYEAVGPDLATAPNQSSSWVPALCEEWEAHDIDISPYAGQLVVIRFTNTNDYGNNLYLDNIGVTTGDVRLAVRCMLQGPFDTGTNSMRDDLRTLSGFPLTEPFTGMGYTHVGGGGETTTAPVLAVTGTDAIVDWILIELRSATDPIVVLASHSALVQRDGDVVDMDGVSPLTLTLAPGERYVAVRHRNHLGIMNAAPIDLGVSLNSIDFTLAATATYGFGARVDIGGVQALWAGDVTFNGQLKYAGSGNDREGILNAVGGTIPTSVVFGYLPEDVTMNGQVKYAGSGNDRDIILQNIGGTVPTAVRNEQVP